MKASKIKIISYPIEPLMKNQQTPIKPEFTVMRNQYCILGSYNGLLCLYDINQCNVILWNPSIKFESQISPTIESFDGNKSLEYYGFGYDQVNDKYKLLVVMRNTRKVSETVTKMYTFGENSLKTICNFPCIPMWRLGKCVSGTLNWVVRTNRVNFDRSILSFHFEKETYMEVSLPQYDGEEYIYTSVLDVLRNYLCVRYESRDQSVMWLMKEYGVAESWTKLMIFPHPTKIKLVDSLFISKIGIVMVKTMCSKLSLNHIWKRRLQPFSILVGSKPEPEFLIYHESLVSL
jgi:F-box interacting protein